MFASPRIYLKMKRNKKPQTSTQALSNRIEVIRANNMLLHYNNAKI